MWLFHLHSAVKNTTFFQFSPWRAPQLRHFSAYSFGVSRKKASTIFITQPISLGSVITYGCFMSKICWKYRLFIQFLLIGSIIGAFIDYSFGFSRNKSSTIFYNTAIKKGGTFLKRVPPFMLSRLEACFEKMTKFGLPVMPPPHRRHSPFQSFLKDTFWIS